MQIDWSNQGLTSAQLQDKLDMFLSSEQSLVSLNIADNAINDLTPLYKAMTSPYIRNTLKILNISANQLTEIALDDLPGLFAVDLSYNEKLTQISIFNTSNLKTIDLSRCSLDDQAVLSLLTSGIKPMQVRLAGNLVTDLGIETIVQNPEARAVLTQMSSLDLARTQCVKYQNLQQVKRLFAPAPAKLPSIKPVDNRSRNSSSRSAAAILGAKSLVQKLDELSGSGSSNFPQILAEVLVGRHSRVYMDAGKLNCSTICAGAQEPVHEDGEEPGSQVCYALQVGVRVHQEIEEALCTGFARKVGSLYCKGFKASPVGCRERCVNVLMTVQKKIDEQMAKKGAYATPQRLDVTSKSINSE